MCGRYQGQIVNEEVLTSGHETLKELETQHQSSYWNFTKFYISGVTLSEMIHQLSDFRHPGFGLRGLQNASQLVNAE